MGQKEFVSPLQSLTFSELHFRIVYHCVWWRCGYVQRFWRVSKSCFYLFINGLKLIFVLMKYELFVLKLRVNLDLWRGLLWVEA